MQDTKTGCCDETGLVFALANLASKAYRGWIKANEALNQAKAKLAQAREAVAKGAKATEEQLAKINEITKEVERRTRDLEKAAEAKARLTAS
jgi:exonuclease VII small subunit